VRGRVEEYGICQERGHVPSGEMSEHAVPRRERCARCRSWFWVELVMRDTGPTVEVTGADSDVESLGRPA
jgi:hypothetical protein